MMMTKFALLLNFGCFLIAQSLEERKEEKAPETCEASATKSADCQIQKLQKAVTRLSDIELEISETKEEMIDLYEGYEEYEMLYKI